MSDSEIRFPLREYQTERLIFRARAVDQAKELYRLINANRKHLDPWMPWVELTREINHTLQYIEMISGHWDSGKTFDFSVFDKETNKLIGSFGLHSINWKNKTCHLGYWIDKDYQGKGLISEAIRAGEKWAQELGFKRICLTCDAKNERSKNSAIRNGYKLEGHFINDQFDRGSWRDTLQFVKLFNEKREGFITENFPFGYSYKECSHEEFENLTKGLHKEIFDQETLTIQPREVISEEEKNKLDKISEKFPPLYRYNGVLFFNDEVAGWTCGYQDGRESFSMMSSAVLPEHRGRGLYSRMLDIILDHLVKMGFQRIWSYHNNPNSQIIIPKLKKGFIVTGIELNDYAGSLIRLTYFSNPTRRKVMQFRAGSIRPDVELKKLLKL